jgi:hypothetical protein
LLFFLVSQFDGSLIVYDVCKEIQEKLGEGPGGADHGLFVPNDDYSRGKWLHPGRTLDYYDVKSGVRALNRIITCQLPLMELTFSES